MRRAGTVDTIFASVRDVRAPDTCTRRAGAVISEVLFDVRVALRLENLRCKNERKIIFFYQIYVGST